MLKLIRHTQHNGLYAKNIQNGRVFPLVDPVWEGELFNERRAIYLLRQRAKDAGLQWSENIPPRHP